MEKKQGKGTVKRILALLLAAVLLLGCQGGGQSAASLATKETAIPTDAPQIRLLSEHEGGVQNLNDEVITTYWSMDFDESLVYLEENCYKATYEAHDGQVLQMRWEGGTAPYTLAFGTAPDLSDAEAVTTERDRYSPGTLYQACTELSPPSDCRTKNSRGKSLGCCLFRDYSIAIVFFSGRAFFSFFGINSFNTPCWNDALTSSSVISSPT